MEYLQREDRFAESTDNDATGSEPIPTLNEFLAVAAKRGASNPYAVIKQLYPHMVFPNDDGKYATNLSSMNAFESCQCFAGPLNSDGLPNYQAYSDYSGGDALAKSDGDRVTWGCTAQGPGGSAVMGNAPDHERCAPQRQGGHRQDFWRCSGRKGGGHSCYTTRRPQTPGPFPRNANWADADILRQGTSTPPSISDDDIVAKFGGSGVKPRWWTKALDGLPAVRAGVLALIDESIWKNPEKWLSTKTAFKKRLYRVSNPDMTEFGYADLEAFLDVGILDIGDAEDTMFVVPNRADEQALYVRTETRDLCNDFGRTGDNNTDWAAHTLTDDLFRAVTTGTPVEYATEDPAAYWNMTGDVAVCAGNLHGMPSNMPGARQSPAPSASRSLTAPQACAAPFLHSRRRRLRAGISTMCRVPAPASSSPCAAIPVSIRTIGRCGPSWRGPSTRTTAVPRQGSRGTSIGASAPVPRCCSVLTTFWYAGLAASARRLLTPLPQTPSDRAQFCFGGGYAGLRGLQMPKTRPASRVCDSTTVNAEGSSGTSTCLAFAGDPIWTVQKVLDQGDSTFPDASGYGVIVVPVRHTQSALTCRALTARPGQLQHCAPAAHDAGVRGRDGRQSVSGLPGVRGARHAAPGWVSVQDCADKACEPKVRPQDRHVRRRL